MQDYRFSGILAAVGAPSFASVSVESRHVTVDPADSIAAFESTSLVFEPDGSGLFVGRQVTTRVETRVSGSFDLLLTTFVWDQDYQGQPVPNPSSETWISFANLDLQTLDAAVAVDLSLTALLIGDQFTRSSGACSFPQDPWTYCTGFDFGPLSSTAGGTLGGSQLAVSGAIPSGWSGSSWYLTPQTTTYSINGTLDPVGNPGGQVPLPSPLLLMAPALVSMFGSKRRP